MKRVSFLSVSLTIAITFNLSFAGWMRIYGGENADAGYSVQQTSDGGYIVSGQTKSFVDPSGDIWLVKFTSSGDTSWTKVYGDTGVDYGCCVKQTSDEGYVVATNLALYKTDSEGEVKWVKSYGSRYVDLTDDGGFILGGPGAVLRKLDQNGDSIWTKTYEESGHINCVRQTEDGNFIATGQQTEIGILDDSYLVDYIWYFKVDSTGNKLWESLVYGEAESNGYSACQASDGGYFFAGSHVWDAASVFHLWVAKTDPDGNVQWNYNAIDDDIYNYRAFGVAGASDGGCVLVGDYWFTYLKYDAQGSFQWEKNLGYVGRSVQQTDDGGYVITGGSSSADLFLLKINSDGDTLAIEEPPPVSQQPDWQVTSIGSRINLRYADHPQGFHAVIFDASGREVDQLHSASSSGNVTWGEGYDAGVYFIKSINNAASAHKVVLVK